MTVRKQKKKTRNNMRNFKAEAIYHMSFQYSSTHKFPFEMYVSTISLWGGWQ